MISKIEFLKMSKEFCGSKVEDVLIKGIPQIENVSSFSSAAHFKEGHYSFFIHYKAEHETPCINVTTRNITKYLMFQEILNETFI